MIAATHRILIVDDEPAIRRGLRSTLNGLGFESAEAARGEEALSLVRTSRFDAVLLDLKMPGIGGVETCRRIRKILPRLPILVISVNDSEDGKVEALDAGADDYVTKPFSMPELLAHIRASLRRTPLSPQDGPATVSFDQIEVNFGTHHVSVNGRDVRLTPKEFEVLHYLIANPNVAIPHSKILQAFGAPTTGTK